MGIAHGAPMCRVVVVPEIVGLVAGRASSGAVDSGAGSVGRSQRDATKIEEAVDQGDVIPEHLGIAVVGVLVLHDRAKA